MRRAGAPPGRMKLVSGASATVHRVDLALEPRDLRGRDAQRARRILAGRRDVGAEIEQVVLDARQRRVRLVLGRASAATPIALFASSTSPIAAISATALDTRDPSTRPGRAVVAGARVDLVELDQRCGQVSMGVGRSGRRLARAHQAPRPPFLPGRQDHDDQDRRGLEEDAELHRLVRLERTSLGPGPCTSADEFLRNITTP